MFSGADGESARDKMKQPCWSLGICVLPGLLCLGFMFIVSLYLYAGVWLVVSLCPLLPPSSRCQILMKHEDMFENKDILSNVHFFKSKERCGLGSCQAN